LALLDGISEILPDDAHLTGFLWSDGQVIMTGMAGDASALIRLLEGSPLLSEVRFSAPVARDARLDRDRFSVTARAGLPGDRP
jgi:general secretion pathway protein L